MFLLPANYYQIKKTKKKGRGAFARQEIPAGTVIGDYLGLLIKDEKIEAIEKKFGDASYAMDYNNNGLSIFPVDIKADGIHLINHSCSANCDAYFYYGHTLYFALRRIFPGEELTIDYGYDPYEAGRCLTPYCHCGSDFCRGTMYLNDKKIKEYGNFYHQETKNQKFKSQKAGEILAPLKKYPKKIKDHQVFNLFSNQKLKSFERPDKKIPSLLKLRALLRLSGRIINFKNLGLKVIAIVDDKIVVKK